MKIAKITNRAVLFNNGTQITTYHKQDDWEDSWAEFSTLASYNINPKTGKEMSIFDIEFSNKILSFIKPVKGEGFNLKAADGSSYFVPCYSMNNGYYSDNLTLIVSTPGKKKQTLKLDEYQSEANYYTPMSTTIWKDSSQITVRELTYDDLEDVISMDGQSGFCLEQWVSDYECPYDNGGYAWGIEADGHPIGYCTIGGADDVCSKIENYPGYNGCYDLLLSDVYIDFDCRHQGLATVMITEAIKMRLSIEPECKHIFCEPMYERLSALYEKCGFETFADGCMVAKARELSLTETKESDVEQENNDMEK